MRTEIIYIEKKEFNNLNIPIIFNDIYTSRRFGVIKNSKFSYRFSWQSDMIQPLLTKITKDICAIGIDQNFAIINFNINSIIYKSGLRYNFYDTKIFNNFIYVITELEIIKINLLTFSVIKEYQLPDIFEEIIFANKNIVVRCFGGSVITI